MATEEEQVTQTDENAEQQEQQEQPKQQEQQTEETEKAPTRNEILRELSKEHGVNLFDAEGLKEFKEFTENQKSEQEKLQEQLDSFKEEKQQWQSEKLKYESKLKANELGIHQDNLEDALKLANNDPDNLEEVVKKYPMFKKKESVKIGMQDPKNFQEPTDNSEVEQFMANDPKYQAWFKKHKK